MIQPMHEYEIRLLAGGNVLIDQVTAGWWNIEDGVLHLFAGTNQYDQPEGHVGSYPLTSILSWKRVAR